MTYAEAVKACNEGAMVKRNDHVGRADKIIVLYGEDWIRVVPEKGKAMTHPIYSVEVASEHD